MIPLLRSAAPCLLLLLGSLHAVGEEGMYPLTDIARLDLRVRGIELRAADIYHPDSAALSDAVVNIRGCTGSFVSGEGLILTNHHCAFRLIQSISTPFRDYLTDGFLARTRREEIPAPGQTAAVRVFSRDVSEEILAGVPDTADPAARAALIGERVRGIIRETGRACPGMTPEVAEMIPGRSWLLTVFTTLRDIRLVFAPPRSIGEFGGENDNWAWPRHTGDFTFLRAYTAPDGSPASYSPDNIPYTPRRYLRVQPAGADEEDPVFIIGYPGRTARHQPAPFLAFEEEVRLPFILDLYTSQVDLLQAASDRDVTAGRKLAPRIKSLANTLKNTRGKLRGLSRLGLVARRKERDRQVQDALHADSVRNARGGTLFLQIDSLYTEIRSGAPGDLFLEHLPRSSVLLEIALAAVDARAEAPKPDSARSTRFRASEREKTAADLTGRLREYVPQADRALLRDMLVRWSRLPAGTIPGLDRFSGGRREERFIDRLLDRLYGDTRLQDTAVVHALFGPGGDVEDASDDPFVELAQAVAPDIAGLRARRAGRDALWNALYSRFLEARRSLQGSEIIPDANNTMRFTCGRIRGYAPADGLSYRPITTVTGLLEKTTGLRPYNTPPLLIERYRAGTPRRYLHPRLNDVPVALLYNLDTVGGNSGSPLMNSRGELVGVNFDRAYEATVNEYTWDESLSRSIGVDIRYILWVTEAVYGGTGVVAELLGKEH